MNKNKKILITSGELNNLAFTKLLKKKGSEVNLYVKMFAEEDKKRRLYGLLAHRVQMLFLTLLSWRYIDENSK